MKRFCARFAIAAGLAFGGWASMVAANAAPPTVTPVASTRTSRHSPKTLDPSDRKSSQVSRLPTAYARGDYRIVYDIDDGNATVYVIKVRHRKDVYRRGRA